MGSMWGSPRKITIERENEGDMLKILEMGNGRQLSDFSDDKNYTDDEFELRQAQCLERIRELERKNLQLYDASVLELARAVKNVEQKYMRATSAPVCADLREAAMQCYAANQKFSLNAFDGKVEKESIRLPSYDNSAN